MAILIIDFAKYAGFFGGAVMGIIRIASPNKLTEFFGLDIWWWALIVIMLALLLTYASRSIRKAKMPAIKAVIERNDLTDRLYADITNTGAEGVFSAQMRIIESSDVLLEASQGIYQAYWEENKGGEIKVNRGDTKRLSLAQFRVSGASGYLRIFSASFFNGCHELNHSYNVLNENLFIIPRVYLILTISSSPSPFEGNMVIGLDIQANRKYETEYSVSKKRQAKIIEKGLTKTQFHKMLGKASQPIKKSEKEKS